MSGSLLNAINVKELITYNADEYVNTAVRLAENVGELKKIRSKIMVNKKILSDVNTYTNNLERAYSKIYNMYLGNEKIENVYIN